MIGMDRYCYESPALTRPNLYQVKFLTTPHSSAPIYPLAYPFGETLTWHRKPTITLKVSYLNYRYRYYQPYNQYLHRLLFLKIQKLACYALLFHDVKGL